MSAHTEGPWADSCLSAQNTQGRLLITGAGSLLRPHLVGENSGILVAACANDPDARRLTACWNAFDGIPTDEVPTVISELRQQIIGERVNHAEQLTAADARYDAKHDAMADTLAELAAARALLADANVEIAWVRGQVPGELKALAERIRAFLKGGA